MKNESMNFDLYKAGVVADLSFSIWGAATQLKSEDLGLENIPKDKISLGHKRLAKKERLESIWSVRNKACTALIQNSFSFPFGSARFVPYARLQDTVDKIKVFEKDFYFEVRKFLEGYEQDRHQMLDEYEVMFEEILSKKYSGNVLQLKKEIVLSKLRDKFPLKEDLGKKFKFELDLFEVSSPEFSKLGTDVALGKAEMESLYREKVSQKLDLFLEEVVSRLKDMVLNSVKKMKERTEKDCLSMKTITSFKKFAESFKSMDFVGTEIIQSISQLEEKLDSVSKSDLSNESFKESLNLEIKSLEESVMSVDIDKVLGRFKRNLRVIQH